MVVVQAGGAMMSQASSSCCTMANRQAYQLVVLLHVDVYINGGSTLGSSLMSMTCGLGNRRLA